MSGCQITSRMSTFPTRSTWNKKTPFCPELRSFIYHSRQYQTLYSNCEGAYSRRVVKAEDEKGLKDYVYSTLYYKEGGCLDVETDYSKIRHVEEISRDIRYESPGWIWGEIHFFVVWVYYFDYNTKEEKSTPVFKIFKSKKTDDCVFLDAELCTYSSWEEYLENAVFPASFLCVPRNGKYHFDDEEDKLDLEFVCSMKAPVEYRRIYEFQPKPFSQVSVYPWITKILNFGAQIWESVRLCMIGLWDFCMKHKSTIIQVVISAISVGKLFSGGDPLNESTLIELGNTFRMLLNCTMPAKADAVESDPEPVETEDQVRDLVALCKEGKKDWRRILRVVCSLVRKGCDFAAAITVFPGTPPLLSLFFVVLSKLTLMLEQSSFLNPIEPPQTETLPIKSGGNSEIEPVPQPPAICLERLNRLVQKSSRAVESDISIIPPNMVEPMTISMSAPVIHEVMVGDLGMCKCYFSGCANSIPKLMEDLTQLLGCKIQLVSAGALSSNVLKPSGEQAGTLYYPTKNVALGLFPLQSQNRGNRKNRKNRKNRRNRKNKSGQLGVDAERGTN